MWEKKGLIFSPNGRSKVMHSHAAIPFADFISGDEVRVYFSSRDVYGKSHPFYIECDINDLAYIKSINEDPLLPLGELGTFDDSGIMPSCVVTNEGLKFMYYIGWNPQVTVSYRLSIGLAISTDDGKTYKKFAEGPICDRSLDEPYFNTAPFVIKDANLWRMWYISCTGWQKINGYPEPKYHVKYAESIDGINWKKTGIVCIDYDQVCEAIGRPCVFFEDGIYKMFFSYRKINGYRNNKSASYRLGYAESKDGIEWEKIKYVTGINVSEKQGDWDAEMICYCHVALHKDTKYMFYNGNGFGKSGIGYAISK